MSRFLGSYRRLRKRVEKLRAITLTEGIRKALGDYATTGELPANLWLRAAVLRQVQFAKAVSATIPEPGEDYLCSHVNCIRGHCMSLHKKGGVDG